MADLRATARGLYARPLSEFVAARKAAADEAGDKELAKQIKALRKPSAAAWAVNALARERAELVEEVVELGEQLRDAQGDADGSRTRLLDRARRDLTRQALEEAATLAEESGGSLSAQAANGVEETLLAAMTDPDAGHAVQDGLLVTTFTASPFEPVDLSDVVAVPPDGARPRPARPKKARSGPTQLERKRLEAAEKKAEQARRKAEAADEAATSALEEREELQDELAELRKQAKELTKRIEDTDAALDKADRAADAAEDAQRAAQDALEDAEAEVERLRSGG